MPSDREDLVSFLLILVMVLLLFLSGVQVSLFPLTDLFGIPLSFPLPVCRKEYTVLIGLFGGGMKVRIDG